MIKTKFFKTLAIIIFLLGVVTFLFYKSGRLDKYLHPQKSSNSFNSNDTTIWNNEDEQNNNNASDSSGAPPSSVGRPNPSDNEKMPQKEKINSKAEPQTSKPEEDVKQQKQHESKQTMLSSSKSAFIVDPKSLMNDSIVFHISDTSNKPTFESPKKMKKN